MCALFKPSYGPEYQNIVHTVSLIIQHLKLSASFFFSRVTIDSKVFFLFILVTTPEIY